MLQIKDLTKDWQGQVVLNNVSLSVNEHDKIALVGPNGVGKSTLLKIMAGLVKADSGEIIKQPALEIAYLPQELKLKAEQTITDYVKSMTGIAKIEEQLETLAVDLTGETKIAAYAEYQEQYERKQGYSFETRLKIMLQGFGLADLKADRLISSLSGGQKTKVALLAVLMQEADLLLLDEPTNNLDLPAIIWLETFLSQTQAGLVVISHDQRFLDKIASRVVALDWFNRQAELFTGTYSEYLSEIEHRIAKGKQAAKQQQEEIKQILQSSRQQKQWAQKGAKQAPNDNDKYMRGAQRDRSAGVASKAKAAEKKISRLPELKVIRERIPLSIPLAPALDKSNPSITLSGIEAGYDRQRVIGPLDLQVEYGSRVAIIGLNGQGKTTLLKVLTGDLAPLAGEVKLSPNLNFGNLMQEHDNLDFDSTVLEFVLLKTDLDKEDIYHLLNVFNFQISSADKKIGQLSPGERARIVLLTFAANSVNALILDEPSNHLDLEALAALEDVLQTYKGIVVFVSHDRYLLDKVRPTKLYQLKEGQLSLVSDFEQYLAELASKSQDLLKKMRKT